MNNDAIWALIVKLSSELDAARINHSYWEDSALFVQGVELPALAEVTVNVQWDQFPDSQQLFAAYGISEVEKQAGTGSFTFERDGTLVRIVCYYNTVVATDKERVAVSLHGHTLYAKSVMHYRSILSIDDPRIERINAMLRQRQRELSEHN
ncbi:MAG: hypothetical protein ACXVDE_03180, partial [Tumebacillaceae bacterium]